MTSNRRPRMKEDAYRGVLKAIPTHKAMGTRTAKAAIINVFPAMEGGEDRKPLSTGQVLGEQSPVLAIFRNWRCHPYLRAVAGRHRR
jgi:hypothetical protein